MFYFVILLNLKELQMKKFSLLFLAFCACHLFGQNCTPVDKPDRFFLDENLDGIDGDTSNAVFVSIDGNDANPGKKWAPVQSLTMAMVLAHGNSKDIYVSAGTYTLSAPLVVYDGVNIYGNFSATTWSRSLLSKVVIKGASPMLYIKGNSKNSTIAGIEFIASDGIGSNKNSYCVFIDSCDGVISLIGNTLRAGIGANGTIGVNGNPGVNGGDGGNGTQGNCDSNNGGLGGSAGSSSVSTGGKGGDGGYSTSGGVIGSSSGSGLIGGGGGASGDPGTTGIDGKVGTNGTDGAGGNTNFVLFNEGYSGIGTNDGIDGSNGTNGTGGSGGGGGGGQHCTFCDDGKGNGGGGGGGAGSMGQGGKSGKGGGNSVGVFVRKTTVYLEDNDIYTKNGGQGGKGGDGGLGGIKGEGGSGAMNCLGEVGAGGNGGDGGKGGNGGGGSGGNGGSSICILSSSNANVFETQNTFVKGNAGNGGLGGNSDGNPSGNNGVTGLSQNIYGAVTNDTLSIYGEICVEDRNFNRELSDNNSAFTYIFLSVPNPSTVKVKYSFTDGTAVNGTDYSGSSGQVIFSPYSTFQTIPFSIKKDNGDTTKRNFTIQLSQIDGDAGFARSSATIKIFPYGSTSVSKVESDNIQIYPNPSNTKFHLAIKAHNPNLTYEMRDVSGRVMCFGHFSELGEAEIDASNLVNGVYYVTVYDSGVWLQTIEFIRCD